MLRLSVKTARSLSTATRAASTAATAPAPAARPRVTTATARKPSTYKRPTVSATPKPSTPSSDAGTTTFAAVAEAEPLDVDEMRSALPELPPPSTASPSGTASAGPPSISFPSTSAFPSASVAPLGPAPVHEPRAIVLPAEQRDIDWTTSFHGLSAQPFSREAGDILMRPLVPSEIEIKPDGLLYLPEILYRRILNKAFGPGGWGMVPRGEMTVLKMLVSREWGLVAGGRLVSVARGEQTFFDPSGLPTATEGCKSNALMRCCKDLGIASELWDPAFIRKFKADHCVEAWTEHGSTKKKQRRWRKKGNKFEYPLVEAKI